jgi:prepilin-type processing-associated H-X9-DG protein
MAYRHNDGANLAFFDGHGEHVERSLLDESIANADQIEKIWVPFLLTTADVEDVTP